MEDEHRDVWEGRLASIEAGHLQLLHDVSELTKDLGSLLQASSTAADAVKTLAANQAATARTNWNGVIAGLVAFIMVIGLVVYEPLHELRTSLGHHLGDGHPNSVVSRISLDAERNRIRHENISATFDAKQRQLEKILVTNKGTEERLLAIEREVYSDAQYRAGRPTGKKK